MQDCIFCKIILGQVLTNFLYEDEWVVAFDDLHPKAPTHVLVVTREHVESLVEAASDEALLGATLSAAHKVAEKLGLSARGYKVVINVGREGGQVIDHLHLHLLGGWDRGSDPDKFRV